MHFNLSTQFCLRILLFTASVNRKTTTREIAEFYGLPLDPVRKAARRLGRYGFLETERGQTGGLRLARPASEIFLGPVIRQLEGDGSGISSGGYEGLSRPHADALRRVMAEAETGFWKSLDQVPLATLTAAPDFSTSVKHSASTEDQRAA
jgi:Rrf2 family transcriptional regulator, nitric oxide-sensitive transcriptional repressor